MSDFEKWFKTTSAYRMLESMNYYKMDLFHWIEARGEYRHTSVQIAFMTWVEQQSKIDELTKQRDSFIKAYEIEIDKSVELQKRIDEALEDLEYPTAPWDETIGSVVKVLRGDE